MEGNTLKKNNNYFYEIAAEFLFKSKRGYFLSPLEIDLIVQWDDKGIPLKIVKKAMKKGFENPGRKKSLLYFNKIVEKEYRLYKKMRTGSKRKKYSVSEPDKKKEIENMINLIQVEYFKNLYKKFIEKKIDYKDKEEFDRKIDDEILKRYYYISKQNMLKEWEENFSFIRVDNVNKEKMIKKYFIIKKRDELNLFKISLI